VVLPEPLLRRVSAIHDDPSRCAKLTLRDMDARKRATLFCGFSPVDWEAVGSYSPEQKNIESGDASDQFKNVRVALCVVARTNRATSH